MSELEVGLSEEERAALQDWWDEETTASVESAFPLIARIIDAHVRADEKSTIELIRRFRDRAKAAEAKVARVEALADRAEANRASHSDLDDCGCSYKDCYECGKWCQCTHTPWLAIREALRGEL